jgi:hypothetical protein
MTNDLAIATARLAEVLTAENEALAALDLPRAGAMLATKTQAADEFVAAQAVAAAASARVANGAVAGAFAGGAPRVAEASQERLRVLVVENQRLLATALTVQRRVIGIIVNALPRAMQGTAPRYGGGGRAVVPPMRAVTISARA